MLKQAIIAVLSTSLFLPGNAAETTPEALTISAAFCDNDDGGSRGLADQFLTRLQLRGTTAAKRGDDCDWLTLPPGSVAGKQVNLLELKFGKRIELLAFMPNANGNGVSLAARATALDQPASPQVYRASPGDQQFAANAPADLVANFAAQMARPSASKATYQLILRTWQRDHQVDVVESGVTALDDSRNAELNKLLPLTMAAMVANNQRASTAVQEQVVVLSFRLGEINCAVHAVLQQNGKTLMALGRYGIRYEQLYDTLRVLLLNLTEWRQTVVDVHNPDPHIFTPWFTATADAPDDAIEAQQTLLIGRTRHRVAGYSPTSKSYVWDAPTVGGKLACRNSQLFSYTDGYFILSRLSATRGTADYSLHKKNLPGLNRLTAEGDSWAYAVNNNVHLFNSDESVWSKPLPEPVQAGPLLSDSAVIVGDAKGDLRCFSLSGQEHWKTALPSPAIGEIYTDHGLLFVSDRVGVLYVISKDGALRWQADLQDVVASAPRVVGETVVVGSKSRELFLFRKETGEALRQRAFTTWLTACDVINDKVVCLTLDQRVHVLDRKTLALTKELRFPFKLRPTIMALDALPRHRASGRSDHEKAGSGFVVADVKGFLYFCDIEGM